MFTRQVGILTALYGHPDISPDLLDALVQLLGNCQQELDHRGPVNIDGPVTINNTPLNTYITNLINNNTNAPVYLFELGGGITEGGSATADLYEWSAGAWSVTATSQTVYDWSRLGPASTGNLGVALLESHSGRYEIIALEKDPISAGTTNLVWCKALDNWVNGSGNDSSVECRVVTDRTGAVEEAGPIDVTVYLPRPNGMQDPNVRQDATICAEVDASGEYIAVSDYLDDRLGTVKMYTGDLADLTDTGWREYTNARGKMPCGVSTDPDLPGSVGAAAGSKEHIHTGVITLPAESMVIVEVGPHPATRTEPYSLSVAAGGSGTGTVSAQTIYGSGMVPTSTESLSGYGSIHDRTGPGGADSATLDGETDGTSLSVTLSGETAGKDLTIPNHKHALSAAAVQAGNGAVGIPSGVSQTGNISPDIGYTGLVQPENHKHSLAGGDGATAAATISPTDHTHTFSDIGIELDDHTHAINISNAPVYIPDHAHDVPVAGIAAGLGVTPGIVQLPTHTHTITPNPHDHGIPGMAHEVSVSSSPHIHGVVPFAAKHIPPCFGIYFIERYE